MDRGATSGGGRAEAERMLSIARKLLEVRDLVGSKGMAESAVEADPLVDGADQILAVSDVLLASHRRINNQFDWYAILQIPSPTDDGGAAIKREFRRLALLLNPGNNSAPGADAAFRLVADAYSVLSNPQKKSLFDAEYRIATTSAVPAAADGGGAGSDDRFWTACPSCCNVHQYARQYLNMSLRCPTCSRPFHASGLAAEPPIVPGTDMYYCSWGFFPMGFPGGPSFNGQYRPFQPMYPNSSGAKPAQAQVRTPARTGNGRVSGGARKNVMASRTKKMARKSVADPGNVRRSTRNLSNRKGAAEDGSSTPPAPAGGVEVRGVRSINLEEDVGGGFNMNREVRGSEGGGNRVDEMNFQIDVDATDEILGNLQNLPFLKDVNVPLRFQ